MPQIGFRQQGDHRMVYAEGEVGSGSAALGWDETTNYWCINVGTAFNEIPVFADAQLVIDPESGIRIQAHTGLLSLAAETNFSASAFTGNIIFEAATTVLIEAGAGDLTLASTAADVHIDGVDTFVSSLAAGGLVSATAGTGLLTVGATPVGIASYFSAFKSSTTNNVTGNGTTAVVVFDTAPTNPGGSYNTATGVYTAAATGLYTFFASVTLTNIAVTHTGMELAFTGSVEGMNTSTINPGVVFSPLLSSSLSQPMSTIIRMTAGDTMSISVTVSGSTLTVGAYGAALPGYITWFRGSRIA